MSTETDQGRAATAATARRLAVGLVVFATAVFGVGVVAPSVGAYPPDGPTVTMTKAVASPGEVLEVELAGCEPGEEVDFVLEEATAVGECEPVDAGAAQGLVTVGRAVVDLQVPSAPGTYEGTATGRQSGVSVMFTVTVAESADAAPGSGGQAAESASGQLPSTGSDGTSPTMFIGAGLLAVGLAMLAVAQWRRRRPHAASPAQ